MTRGPHPPSGRLPQSHSPGDSGRCERCTGTGLLPPASPAFSRGHRGQGRWGPREPPCAGAAAGTAPLSADTRGPVPGGRGTVGGREQGTRPPPSQTRSPAGPRAQTSEGSAPGSSPGGIRSWSDPHGGPPGGGVTARGPHGEPPLRVHTRGNLTWGPPLQGPHLRVHTCGGPPLRGTSLGTSAGVTWNEGSTRRGAPWGASQGCSEAATLGKADGSRLRPEMQGQASGLGQGLTGTLTPAHLPPVGLGVGVAGPRGCGSPGAGGRPRGPGRELVSPRGCLRFAAPARAALCSADTRAEAGGSAPGRGLRWEP